LISHSSSLSIFSTPSPLFLLEAHEFKTARPSTPRRTPKILEDIYTLPQVHLFIYTLDLRHIARRIHIFHRIASPRVVSYFSSTKSPLLFPCIFDSRMSVYPSNYILSVLSRLVIELSRVATNTLSQSLPYSTLHPPSAYPSMSMFFMYSRVFLPAAVD